MEMLLTIFPSKRRPKSPSKLRRKFATNFAENFANFTLEIAGACRNSFEKCACTEQMETEGLRRKLLLTPSVTSGEPLEKKTVVAISLAFKGAQTMKCKL